MHVLMRKLRKLILTSIVFLVFCVFLKNVVSNEPKEPYTWNQKIEEDMGFISNVHLFVAMLEDFREKHEKLKTRNVTAIRREVITVRVNFGLSFQAGVPLNIIIYETKR